MYNIFVMMSSGLRPSCVFGTSPAFGALRPCHGCGVANVTTHSGMLNEACRSCQCFEDMQVLQCLACPT